MLILGTLFLLIGVGFKLAAVPFHFWCPDVFEGASAEVAGFLSVASKAAALALMIRLVLVFTGVDPLVNGNGNWMAVLHYIVPALAVFAGLTATFGNLAAFRQTNLKRLLAYSTIAHAGYMMMGLCALTTPRLYLPGGQAVIGAEAVLFYLIAYLFMNLGAFAVVAFIRNQTGSEDLSQMRGLVRRSPWMVVTLSFFLLSLLGIPPLIGFTAKLQIFYALWRAGQYYWGVGQSGLGFTLLALLGVGCVNSVISAVYYLKVMKVMIIEGRAEDLEGAEPVRLPEPAGAVFYATVMALVVLGLGLAWNPLSEVSAKGVERYFPQPVAANAGPPAAPGGAPGGRPGEAGRPGGRRGVRGRRRGWRINRDRPPHPGRVAAGVPAREPVDAALRRRGVPLDGRRRRRRLASAARDRGRGPRGDRRPGPLPLPPPDPAVVHRLVPQRLHDDQLPLSGISAAAAGRFPAEGRSPTWSATRPP